MCWLIISVVICMENTLFLLFISIFWSDIFRLFESNINQEEFYLVAICSWRPGDLYYTNLCCCLGNILVKISSFSKQPEHLFSLWFNIFVYALSELKNVIILCGTNNICTDSPYDIVQCLLDIGVCFRNRSSKIKILISRILPRDESYSKNRMSIKEINTTLKCKCTFHRFNFIEKEQG